MAILPRQYFRDDSSFVFVTLADVWNALFPGATPPATTPAIRQPIRTNTTFFINPATGDNTKDGLTTATAWLDMTPLAQNYDVQATVTLQWVAGTYTNKSLVAQSYVGNGSVIFQGDMVNYPPTGVVLQSTVPLTFFVLRGAVGNFTIQGFRVTSTAASIGILVANSSSLFNYQLMDFGPMPGGIHVVASIQANINTIGNCTISGGAATHLDVEDGSVAHVTTGTMTLTGTPVFSQVLLSHGAGAIIGTNSANWSGAASAGTKQWNASLLSLIDTAGTSAALPGGTPGVPAAGVLSGDGCFIF